MGTPQDHLPAKLADETIDALMDEVELPRPTCIETLAVSAAFHSIYMLHFPGSAAPALLPAKARNPDGSITLVLRVSGGHLPRVKTMNEVGVMRWVSERTRPGTVPVPAVVRYSDDATANALGYEYTLLERGPGRSGDALTLGPAEARDRLVECLTEVLVELADERHTWSHVGGLRVGSLCLTLHGQQQQGVGEGMRSGKRIDEDDGDDEAKLNVVVPGPVLDETFWTDPDVAALWTPLVHGISAGDLNPRGPYGSHGEYVAAYLECYAWAIDAHPTLAWLREGEDAIPPRLRLLAELAVASPKASGQVGGEDGEHTTQQRTGEEGKQKGQREGEGHRSGNTNVATALAAIRLILAHKDLHMANVMATPDGQLTAVLDWEFAGVVPANRWDPARAFLWDGRTHGDDEEAAREAAQREKDRLWAVFERSLQRKGVKAWWREGSEEQRRVVDDVWTALGYVRALVEVCPRGQKGDAVKGWRSTLEGALTRLGV